MSSSVADVLQGEQVAGEVGAKGMLKRLDPLKCAYIVTNKRRQCSRARQPPSEYCGNHAHLALNNEDDEGGGGFGGARAGTSSGTLTDGASSSKCQARVLCPVDPSHTVRTVNLDKHVRKCEAVKRHQRKQDAAAAREAAPKPPYYRRDINSGGNTRQHVASKSHAGDSHEVVPHAAVQMEQTGTVLLDIDMPEGSGGGDATRQGQRKDTVRQDMSDGDVSGKVTRHHECMTTDVEPNPVGLSDAEKLSFVRSLVNKHGAVWLEPLPTLDDLMDMLPNAHAALNLDTTTTADDGQDEVPTGIHHDVTVSDDEGDVGVATDSVDREPASAHDHEHDSHDHDHDPLRLDIVGGGETTGTPHERRFKHRVQEVSIARHLAAAGLIGASHPATLVELGAGTGGLSKRVQWLVPGTPTVLVERETMKRRHDMYWSDLAGVFFYRATIDIRHLYLGALPCVDDRRPVAVAAKHLCGVASDLAVNAVMSSTLEGSDTVSPPAGVAIATCCHQLCTWKDYPDVAKEWLHKQCGAGQAEFELMIGCAGWAIDGGPDRPTDGRTDRRRARKRQPLLMARERAGKGDAAALAEIAAIETANAAAVEARAWRKALDPTERLAVGRACKLVLDLGRREALRAAGLRCELVRYCGSEITLENRLLLAWRP